MWDDLGWLARALRAWIYSWTLSVNRGESDDELGEELSELDEDELSDGIRTVEQERFSELEWSKDMERGKEQERIKEEWKPENCIENFEKLLRKKEVREEIAEKKQMNDWGYEQ